MYPKYSPLSTLFSLFLLFTACAGTTEKPIPSEHTTSSQKQISTKGAEYRAQWRDDYNYNTPVLIDSFRKWQDFLAAHPGNFTRPDSATEHYSRSFFQDSVVYAYLKSESSGANQLRIEKVRLEGDTLKLYMENIIPQMGTMDMATRVCFFGISRDVMDKAEEVEAVIIRKEG
ncbi:MAG: hypothetical protein ACLFQB_04115 [Chitinispirillaceae bacterium]